jgi:diguanylate cyclase (GGDEF)-like protein/PAS domain S-box-containing protein
MCEIMDIDISASKIKHLTIKWDFNNWDYFKKAPIGLYIIQNKKFKALNDKFIAHTGYSEDELLEIDPLVIVSESFRKSVRKNAIEMLNSKRDKPYEYLANRKDGQEIWVVEAVVPIEIQGKRAVAGFFMDIASIVNDSITDVLTGLFNRRFLNNKLEEESKRSERYQSSLSLILLDVDFFKKYNDTFGHTEGDKILSRIGDTIKRCIRQTDFGCRYGGEEFAIILPETIIEDAILIAERICKGVELDTAQFNTGATISAGVSGYTKKQSINEFISKTDFALYEAKKCGRNCVKYS